MFGSKRKTLPIALDVGSSSLKMLQLTRGDRGWRVLAGGKFEFPSDLRRASDREELLASAIRELLKDRDFRGRDVVTVVPNQELHFKSFRLPQLPDSEVEQVARYEAEERFSWQSKQVEYRFLRAGEIRQGQEVREEIIAMACESESLGRLLDLYTRLGLVCLAIDVSACCLVRSFERPDSNPPDPELANAYIDVGQQATRVIITRGGQIIFVKIIAIGGDRFCEMIAKQLHLSAAEASQIRREILNHDRNPQAQISQHLEAEIVDTAREAVRGDYEQLAKEIGLCLRYYSVTFRGVRPEKLICAGGQSYDHQLLKTISELTGVEATAASPLEGLYCPKGVLGPEGSGLNLEWATACGLALREAPVLAERMAS